MQKIRVIPTLLHDGGTLIKGVRFDHSRKIGFIRQAVMVYERRQVDELIILDIGATKENRRPDFELIKDIASDCFMPLTVGGGVRDVSDFRDLLLSGADKVAINTMAVERPELIGEASRKFGAQSVVVSIDVRGGRVFSQCGRRATNRCAVEWAKEAESRGAGEILLTAIDRDGVMDGYDLDLIERVSSAVSIPVIASGGASSAADMKAALDAGASAVACASIFHFTEQTPQSVKLGLDRAGVAVRLL